MASKTHIAASTSTMGGQCARTAMLRGMDQMTALISPTLGPVARTVAIAGATGTSVPEVLDNAATIARRTIELADPFENMGAMITRQLAWSIFEAVGDGSATAAVLCHEMVRAAAPVVASGGNPMVVKRGMERGLRVAVDELHAQARPFRLPAELARAVAGTLREPGLAEMVGEIIETIGADGGVVVEDTPATTTSYEYIEGVRWESGYISYYLLRNGETEARLQRPRILFVDKKLGDDELIPVIETCIASNVHSLLVVAPGLSDAAVALLTVNRDRGVLEEVMAAKPPLHGAQRDEVLQDLAAITGGRYIHTEAGDRLSDVVVQDLGAARHAWVTASAFGIIGGHGQRGAIRQRASEAKAQLRQTKPEDRSRQVIADRLGKLTGASAIIRVGAPTITARAELRGRVEAAVTTARAMLREGGVPGGGAAFVGCVPALDRLRPELAGDEAVGVAVLSRALFAPMMMIARNGGAEPSVVAADARRYSAGFAFDAINRTWVDAFATGIVDPLPVAIASLEGSVSAATMALTTDVLVRHSRPRYSINP